MTYEERTVEVQVPRVVTETLTKTIQVPRCSAVRIIVEIVIDSVLCCDIFLFSRITKTCSNFIC